MNTLFKITTVITVTLLFFFVKAAIMSNYTWEQKYSNEWSLADKSSTIVAKQQHIDKFVESLDEGNKRGEFSSHNAIFLKTPNNSFEHNLNALRTLQERLKTVQDMDPNSFEYNTAIQQITAQEQGEAGEMISTFQECYNLANYPMVWNWIGNTLLITLCTLICLILPAWIIVKIT